MAVRMDKMKDTQDELNKVRNVSKEVKESHEPLDRNVEMIKMPKE